MTGSYVQMHKLVQILAVLDMQTQIQALTVVHVTQKLDAVQASLVCKNIETAAVDLGAWRCSKLDCSY